ncbi:hypothetical protein DFJ73DRAFT_919671 [Zopfochytrium polystomum]|nr:hypothetical protein DFJ73DRAFT_919671 [Zopfochytrium polystomum]
MRGSGQAGTLRSTPNPNPSSPASSPTNDTIQPTTTASRPAEPAAAAAATVIMTDSYPGLRAITTTPTTTTTNTRPRSALTTTAASAASSAFGGTNVGFSRAPSHLPLRRPNHFPVVAAAVALAQKPSSSSPSDSSSSSHSPSSSSPNSNSNLSASPTTLPLPLPLPLPLLPLHNVAERTPHADNKKQSLLEEEVPMSIEEKTACVSVLNGLQSSAEARPFSTPFAVQEWIASSSKLGGAAHAAGGLSAPPVDLSSVEKRLHANEYPSISAFVDDIRLLFQTVAESTSSASPVWRMAQTLEDFFVWQLETLGEPWETLALPRVLAVAGSSVQLSVLADGLKTRPLSANSSSPSYRDSDMMSNASDYLATATATHAKPDEPSKKRKLSKSKTQTDASTPRTAQLIEPLLPQSMSLGRHPPAIVPPRASKSTPQKISNATPSKLSSTTTTLAKPTPSTKSGSQKPDYASRSCACCGTRVTPMWRQGPKGLDILCNGCGVKYRRGKLVVDGTLLESPPPRSPAAHSVRLPKIRLVSKAEKGGVSLSPAAASAAAAAAAATGTGGRKGGQTAAAAAGTASGASATPAAAAFSSTGPRLRGSATGRGSGMAGPPGEAATAAAGVAGANGLRAASPRLTASARATAATAATTGSFSKENGTGPPPPHVSALTAERVDFVSAALAKVPNASLRPVAGAIYRLAVQAGLTTTATATATATTGTPLAVAAAAVAVGGVRRPRVLARGGKWATTRCGRGAAAGGGLTPSPFTHAGLTTPSPLGSFGEFASDAPDAAAAAADGAASPFLSPSLLSSSSATVLEFEFDIADMNQDNWCELCQIFSSSDQ